MANQCTLSNQSILNAAPQLVAWGLAHGLLRDPGAPVVDPRSKYLQQQREAARLGMQKLREAKKALELPL